MDCPQFQFQGGGSLAEMTFANQNGGIRCCGKVILSCVSANLIDARALR